MDKASIIEFSNTVRDRLYEETKSRAANYGIFPDKIQDVDKEFEDSIVIGGRVFNRKIKRQREQLVREAREKGYDQLIDEVTYTWFNRFVALKFMEVNGYLPGNVKVFSSNEVGKTEPDILSKSLKLDFLNIDRNAIIDLKSAGKDEELYKILTLSLCNYLNKIMPFLFENIEDHTELLFPDKLLHTDSILRDINSIIKEEDWKEVEVIGWIYEDYIAEKKDVLIHAKKQYLPNQISTVTQLFTPKWIVRYMVQNSLGRYWLESHPNKELQSKFEFYLESREENYLDKLKDYIDRTLSPENIKFLDPGMGSAHILVYAFDVFYEIYRISGYLEDEIPGLILTKNLYGLEIDDRATQLAGFALLMKARQYDKKLFEKKIVLNIAALQETNNFTDEDIKLFAGNNNDYIKVEKLFHTFKDAKTLGSIIKVDDFDEAFFIRKLDELKNCSNLRKYEILDVLAAIIKQARMMTQTYDVVAANPPYLNSSYMPAILKEYLNINYPNTKYDLFSVFIEFIIKTTKKNGHIGLVTPYVWMFLKSYEWLRNFIVENENISSLVQLEYNAFSAACVPVCTFTIRNQKIDCSGEYIQLSDFKGIDNQPIKVLDAIRNPHVEYRFTKNQKELSKITGSPIAYWVSERVCNAFKDYTRFEDLATTRKGMVTARNDAYVRDWHEVSIAKSGLDKICNRNDAKKSGKKWFSYLKGGGYRKWFGNKFEVVNWENDGELLQTTYHPSEDRIWATNFNLEYIFKPNVNWGAISSLNFSARISFGGELFDAGGSACFPKAINKLTVLGFLNSKVSQTMLRALNPTLNFQAGNIADLPLIKDVDRESLHETVTALVKKHRIDWDSNENSWDFKSLPLINSEFRKPTLKATYIQLRANWRRMTLEMQQMEEENNRIFIEAYSLKDELTNEVPLNEITLTCNPWYRYGRKCENQIMGEFPEDAELEARLLTDTMKEFMSYAIGCMFGRYSPDKEGLILANKGETIKDFTAKVPAPSFMPDDDNIIPVLEDEYFKDDIVSRFKDFLKITFGAESLAENLDFIAGTLSKTKKGGESSEKIIRDYFLKSFFKDHARTYQKRPIYWLFTSGKGRGFNALVYMHRYDKTLLAKIRTDYLLELEAKLDTRMEMLSDSPRDKQEKERLGKLMKELMAYDEKLNNKALAFIDIDFDDGVAVNYGKFEGLVEEI